LEFKSPTGKGRLSDNQKRWAELLRKVGWRVEIVTTAEDAWGVVTSHLGIENG
jgi:predicted methyltransferase